MFKPEVLEEIGNVAAEFGLETAALLAVAEIESGGHAFAAVAGRREPLIRFEGHYFDRRLSAENRSRARSLGLSSPTAGAIPNPASQADALRQRDWAAFARGYNGPGYRANRYDAKLAQAFARHSSATSADRPGPATAGPAGTLLKHGDRGAAVADVQVALTSAGYPVPADGVFGPFTAEAVRRYQRDHGLVVDGIAGPSTLSSLRASLSLWNRIGRFCARLATLFGRSREKAA
jgi:hypothetical protein